MSVSDFLATLMNAYPSFEPRDPAGMLRLWSSELGDYSDRQLDQAARELIGKGSAFFPSLPQVKSVLPAQTTPGDTPDRYWEAMQFLGEYMTGKRGGEFIADRRYRQFFTRRHHPRCGCRICQGDITEDQAWEQAERLSAEWMRG